MEWQSQKRARTARHAFCWNWTLIIEFGDNPTGILIEWLLEYGSLKGADFAFVQVYVGLFIE